MREFFLAQHEFTVKSTSDGLVTLRYRLAVLLTGISSKITIDFSVNGSRTTEIGSLAKDVAKFLWRTFLTLVGVQIT